VRLYLTVRLFTCDKLEQIPTVKWTFDRVLWQILFYCSCLADANYFCFDNSALKTMKHNHVIRRKLFLIGSSFIILN